MLHIHISVCASNLERVLPTRCPLITPLWLPSYHLSEEPVLSTARLGTPGKGQNLFPCLLGGRNSGDLAPESPKPPHFQHSSVPSTAPGSRDVLLPHRHIFGGYQ